MVYYSNYSYHETTILDWNCQFLAELFSLSLYLIKINSFDIFFCPIGDISIKLSFSTFISFMLLTVSIIHQINYSKIFGMTNYTAYPLVYSPINLFNAPCLSIRHLIILIMPLIMIFHNSITHNICRRFFWDSNNKYCST